MMESEHPKTSAEIKYADIICGTRPYSAVHPPMDRVDRAAQFAPFAALSGLEGAVVEAARITESRIELDEYEIERLDRCLQRLAEESYPTRVRITYFQPDRIKRGGSYITLTDTVDRVDPIEQMLLTSAGVRIPFCDILGIEGTE